MAWRPAELMPRLHSVAVGLGRPLTNEASAQSVRSMVAVLQPLVEQTAHLTRRIERFVESLPDGPIVMSFPRAGHVCAAQILAERGDVRERIRSLDQSASEAGTVPVTCPSGKTRSLAFRWARNHRLRKAVTCRA